MKPGRELDALIAEKVFGHQVCRNTKGGWSLGEQDWYDSAGEMILSNPLPQYSEDIASAWQIVRHLNYSVWDLGTDCEGWFVCLTVSSDGTDKIVTAKAPTIEEAICLAALKAVSK